MPYAYQVRDRKRVKRGVLTGLLLLCLALLIFLIPFGALGWSRPGSEDDRKSEESTANEPSVALLGAGRASAETSADGSLRLGSGSAEWVDPAAACGDCAGYGLTISSSSAALLSELDNAPHPVSHQLGMIMRQMAAGAHLNSPSAGDRGGSGGSRGSAGTGGAGGMSAGGGKPGAPSESSGETRDTQPINDPVQSTPDPAAGLPPGESPDRGSGPRGGTPGGSDRSDDKDAPSDDRRGGDNPVGLVPSAPSGPGSAQPFAPPAPAAPGDSEKVIKELLEDRIDGPIADAPSGPSDPFGPPPSTGPSVDDPPRDEVPEVPEPSPLALFGVALFAAAAYRFRHLLVR